MTSQGPGSSWPPPGPDQQPLGGPPAAPQAAPQGTGFGKVFLASAVWAGVNLVVTLLVTGPPPSSEAAGAFVGGLIIPVLLAALITWAIARRPNPRRPQGWSFGMLVLLALPFYLVLRLVAAVGGG